MKRTSWAPSPPAKERKEKKRREAEDRNAAWAALSPRKQLQSLHDRGHAAVKQRARIIRQMKETA